MILVCFTDVFSVVVTQRETTLKTAVKQTSMIQSKKRFASPVESTKRLQTR